MLTQNMTELFSAEGEATPHNTDKTTHPGVRGASITSVWAVGYPMYNSSSCNVVIVRTAQASGRAHSLVRFRAPPGVRGWFVRGCFGEKIYTYILLKPRGH